MSKRYQEVYEYYLELMKDGRLPEGSRMPSLRSCALALNVSRTTAETAYMLLSADGYIVSKEKSGFFVTDMAKREKTSREKEPAFSPGTQVPDRLDISTVATDPDAFCHELWRRYMKSALRNDVRLATYGETQGEYDLRVELSGYVRARRNIICSPDDIVVGPGVQYLLSIVAGLLPQKDISLPARSFHEADRIFTDYGFDVHYRDKTCRNIYVVPSYMTAWGEVMTKTRLGELLVHGQEGGHMIIEDDYLNEFVYSGKMRPSLYALSGGSGVVYLGSFSRILLPSIRISFMILPVQLREKYRAKRGGLSQLASKTEQIALCQFLRDGHLSAHIRKLRRLYGKKREAALEAACTAFAGLGTVKMGEGGTELAVTFSCRDKKAYQNALDLAGLYVRTLQETEDEITVLLSCAGPSEEAFARGVKTLADIVSAL